MCVCLIDLTLVTPYQTTMEMAVPINDVRRVKVVTAEDFQERVYKFREPTILCGLDLGLAPSLWTPQYLGEKCGNIPVKIHVCPQEMMDFIHKNFAYRLNSQVISKECEVFPFHCLQDTALQ